ncbi:hypothetical protein BCV70DRAFT_1798 [Testicularia cyperi]|uniref:Rad60/SUMO-like domain-containing protein n=1 Tax=Testicularia cyperi TaxID=1882483 RepID=A0A317XW82_9BASI|nr:hypothetical protein BCV70DRAFT_1798 [Testicularia cyperi]
MEDDDLDFFTRKPSSSRARSHSKQKPFASRQASIHAGPSRPSSSSVKLESTAKGGRVGSAQPSSSDSAHRRNTDAEQDELASIRSVNGHDGDDDSINSVLDNDGDDGDDDDDDNVTIISSEEDEDQDYAGRPRKRQKKRPTTTLPAWALENRAYPPPPPSSDTSSTFHSARSELPPASPTLGATATTANAKEAAGRSRQVSLTPPPEPSPDKLEAAKELVRSVMSTQRSGSPTKTLSSGTVAATAPLASSSTSTSTSALALASATRRTTRSSSSTPAGPAAATRGRTTRNSSTALHPGSDAALATDRLDDLVESDVDWDPELATLYRGENAKQVRDRAKQAQLLRDRQRKQRELERSTRISGRGGALARTTSAPNPASVPGGSARNAGSRATTGAGTGVGVARIVIASSDAEDSDGSVEFVPRYSPTRRTSARSPLKPRNGALAEPVTIELSDSDSDDADADADADGDGVRAGTARPADGDVAVAGLSGATTTGGLSSSSSLAPEDTQLGSVASAGSGTGEVLTLNLTSQLGGTLETAVRRTTTLSRLLSHFHASFTTPDTPARTRIPATVGADTLKIRFDGQLFVQTLTASVGDLDPEDGDLVEVVW